MEAAILPMKFLEKIKRTIKKFIFSNQKLTNNTLKNDFNLINK